MPTETRRFQRRFVLIALPKSSSLGWRPGMALVGVTIQDQVQVKSVTYGNGQQHEQDATIGNLS
jgi:hypothetical protein